MHKALRVPARRCLTMRAALLALLAGLLLAACGQRTAPAPAPADTPAAEEKLTPILAASELTVGPNRLPIGVLRNGTPLNDTDLTLHLRFFYLDGGAKEEVRSEADAVYRGEGLPWALYVAYVDLDQPGAWAAEVQIPRDAGPPQVSRMRLDVQTQSATPSVGSPAIPSRNQTIHDVPDLAQLTSDGQPDPDLYQLSIADAIAAGKPFLVTFSTPGYCKTAVCAPNLQVIKQVKTEFADQVNFLHVEVYPYPFGDSFQQQRLVPAMSEWRLRTEPWTFLVDAQGIIQAKYEGGLTFAELEPALRRLAAGEPVS